MGKGERGQEHGIDQRINRCEYEKRMGTRKEVLICGLRDGGFKSIDNKKAKKLGGRRQE